MLGWCWGLRGAARCSAIANTRRRSRSICTAFALTSLLVLLSCVRPLSVFRYEFETPQREHIAMVAAAQRGKIYVCGGATPREKWPQYGPQLLDTVRSFRLKDLGK